MESRIKANTRCMERLGRKVRGEIGAQLSKMVSQDSHQICLYRPVVLDLWVVTLLELKNPFSGVS